MDRVTECTCLASTIIFTKTARVMTDAPSYDWYMTNLGNYVNLSNTEPNSVDTSKLRDITAVGQRGGGYGLPGDYTPPSRFIKTAYLAHHSDRASGLATTVNEFVHILNNIDVPLGVVAAINNGKIVSDSTKLM
ncbi:MAG: linear amide C-N hydrolase [Fusobacteria bacterium]|nr:linear amide C-N hydrolase [Fusobacteriota bacterium]